MGGVARAEEAANAEPQADNTGVAYVADPSTALNGRDILGQEGGRYAGRVWSDKSVYTDDTVDLGNGITASKGDAEFLTVFSALGSSRTVTSTIPTPLDVVFVVDISGSMNDPVATGTSTTRIAATISALNSAMATLMENPNARVGLVVFSSAGYSDSSTGVRTVLELGRYQPSLNNGSDYVAMNGNNSSFSVGARPVDESGTIGQAQTSSISVVGGTNTQRGIYQGMSVLNSANSTTLQIGNQTLQRVPALILLSDGAPTFSAAVRTEEWRSTYINNWWEPLASGTTEFGNGNTAYYGNGMLAMMTAAYMKAQVDAHYGVANSPYATKIYTVGMGVDNLSGNDRALAQVTLDPSSYLHTASNSMAQSISSSWDTYRAGQRAPINVNGSNNYYLAANPPIDLSNLDIAYNDGYYAADQNISDVFQDIITSLTSQAFVPTQDTTGTSATTGITYRDPLGEYMEVKDVQSVVLFGKAYDVAFNREAGTCQVEEAVLTHPVYGTQINTKDITINVANGELTVNIPSGVLPVRCESVTTDANNNVTAYSTNADDPAASPLRVLYTVGLAEDVKSNGNIDLSKVDPEYIRANTDDEGKVNFYTNAFDAASTEHGLATVEFSPSEQNRYYYFQAQRVIFSHAEGLDENGEANLTVNGKKQEKVSVSNPVTEGSLDLEKTYYLVIDYYRPGTGGQGEYVEHVVSRTGAELKDSVALTKTDSTADYIASGSGDVSVLATKVGGVRLGRLNRFTATKSENVTHTAVDVYAPTYTGGGVTDPTGGNAFTVYLGNNGRASVPTSSLFIAKNVTAEPGVVTPAGQDFTFDITLTGMGAAERTLAGQVFVWEPGTEGDVDDGRYVAKLDDDGKPVVQEVTFSPNGAGALEAQVPLKASEALLFTNLTPGAGYTVAEDTSKLDSSPDADALATTGYSYKEATKNGQVVEAVGAEGQNPTVEGTIAAYAQERVVFTNEYVSQVARAELPVTKVLDGRNFQQGDSFSFSISAGAQSPADTPLPKNQTVTLKPAPADFSTSEASIDLLENNPIVFTRPGTYHYIISEVVPQGDNADNAPIPGVSYDGTRYRATIVVKANNDGTLSAERTLLEKGTPAEDGYTWEELDANADITFTNTYNASVLTLPVSASKVLRNAPLSEFKDAFSFVMEAAGSRSVADGNAEFKKDLNQPMPGGTVADDGTVDQKTVATQGDSLIEGNGPTGGISFGTLLLTAEEAGASSGVDTTQGMEYLYRFYEKLPADGNKQNGVTYDTTVYERIVRVYTTLDDDGNSVVAITITDPNAAEGEEVVTPGSMTFTNTYNAETTLDLGVSKIMEGRAFQEGDSFTFRVSPSEGRPDIPLPTQREVTIDPAAGGTTDSASFGAITYTQADAARGNQDGTRGRYYYYIDEAPGGLGGVTYDGARYRVTVQVTDNYDGTLTAQIIEVAKDADGAGSNASYVAIDAPEGGWSSETAIQAVAFTNRYEAQGASLALTGTKTLAGKQLNPQEFGFTVAVANADGAVLNALPQGMAYLTAGAAAGATSVITFNDGPAEGSSTANISLLTPDATPMYTQPGTYYYLVFENVPSAADANPNMTYDTTRYLVSVEVTDNGQGNLVAEVVSVQSKPGELSVGWQPAGSNGVAFVNTYQGASLLPLGVTKELVGGELAAGEYEFILTVEPADEDTAQTGMEPFEAIATNGVGRPDQEGNLHNVYFDTVRFTKPGTYTIAVREVIPEDAEPVELIDAEGNVVDTVYYSNGVLYDGHTVSSTIRVTADDQGNLTALRDGTVGNRNFVNSKGLEISKALEISRPLEEGEEAQLFSFTIELTGTDAPQNGVYPVRFVRADGSAELASLAFEAGRAQVELAGGDSVNVFLPANQAYRVVENPTEGWTTTSSAEFTGTMGAGALAPAAFVNAKDADPVDWSFAGAKTLSGRDLRAGEFSFTYRLTSGNAANVALPEGLVDDQGAVTVSNDAEGAWESGTITFTAPGRYGFEVREVASAAEAGVTYDQHIYTVIAVVEDTGARALEVTSVEGMPEGGLAFSNSYGEDAEASVSITGTKTLLNRALQPNEFSFELLDATGARVAMGTNGEGGAFVIGGPGLTFTMDSFTDEATALDNGGRTQDFVYTLREVVPADEALRAAGVAYDTQLYTVVVTLVDDGKGGLEATAVVTNNNGDVVQNPAFSNVYQPNGETSATLQLQKTLFGRAMAERDFGFVVTDLADGTQVAAGQVPASNDGVAAQVSCTPIVFDAAAMADAEELSDGSRVKTFSYRIDEVNGGLDDVRYDERSFFAQVTVVDDGRGTLAAQAPVYYANAEFSEPLGEGMLPHFMNYYAQQVSFPPAVFKMTDAHDDTDLSDFEFGYVVIDNNGGDRQGTVVSAGTSLASGVATFDAIEFDRPGTYHYIVREAQGGDGGLTYDASSYYLEVTVEDPGTGQLAIGNTVYRDAEGNVIDGGIVFHNSYDGGVTTLDLSVSKLLDGRDLAPNEFSFVLVDAVTGEEVAAGTNDANGTVSLSSLSYSYRTANVEDPAEPEEPQDPAEPEEPANPNEPTVEAPTDPEEPAESENPEQPAEPEDPAEPEEPAEPQEPADTTEPEAPEEPSVDEGEQPAEELQGFDGFEAGEEPTGLETLLAPTVAIADDGDAEQYSSNMPGLLDEDAQDLANDATASEEEPEPISSDLGLHYYILKEVVPQGAYQNPDGTWTYRGVTFDADRYYITVNVVDQGDGTIAASVVGVDLWPGGNAANAVPLTLNAGNPNDLTGVVRFENTYREPAAPVVELAGTKELTGRPMAEAEFGFEVVDANGTVVASGKNVAAGDSSTVTFSRFVAPSVPGTYTYQVVEARAGSTVAGVSYSEQVFPVSVTVVRADNGLLSAEVAYPSGPVAFQNTYQVEGSVAVELAGTKTLTGRDAEEGEFAFAVTTVDGDAVAAGTSGAAAQGEAVVIDFGSVTFSQVGEYDLVVTEVLGGQTLDGVVYDGTSFPVHVSVVDTGRGTLAATVSYPEGAVAFVNAYETTDASVVLKANKTLEGRELVADAFTFVVRDEQGAVVAQATNGADGAIVFPAIAFNEAGVYEYTVSEVLGREDGMTYDERVFGVTVTVTDNGKGQLVAAVAYANGEPAFVNTYDGGEPEDPDNPDGPEDPENPEDPDGPEDPDNPDQPTQPEGPGGPSQPVGPNKPAQPQVPQTGDGTVAPWGAIAGGLLGTVLGALLLAGRRARTARR